MKIISVNIVNGNNICRWWKAPVQVVETSEGNYIDSLPNISHNYKKNNQKHGYNWAELVGKDVDISNITLVGDSRVNCVWIKHKDSLN